MLLLIHASAYAYSMFILIVRLIFIVLFSPLQVSDSGLILGQLAGIDMLTQEGEANSVSTRFLFLCTFLCTVFDNVKSVMY